MSTETTIYHNPRCSKSRQALALLEAKGVESNIVPYLDAPPDATTLKHLLKLLGLAPRELMRRKEAAFTDLNLADPALSDDALIDAMITHPILIERPIVVHGDRAVLGRPPENVLTLL